MKIPTITIPPILFKAKRAVVWLWLGFVACMISAVGAKHMGWETFSFVLSSGMLFFAASFAGCIVLMFVLICAAIIRPLTGSNRNV